MKTYASGRSGLLSKIAHLIFPMRESGSGRQCRKVILNTEAKHLFKVTQAAAQNEGKTHSRRTRLMIRLRRLGMLFSERKSS